jgi:hypothetical protein
MILSPFSGVIGRQAVNTVVRGDDMIVQTKKKATPECSLYNSNFISF